MAKLKETEISGNLLVEGDANVTGNLTQKGEEVMTVVRSSSAPSNKNALWYDTTNNVLKYWNGTKWFAPGTYQ